MSSTTDTSRAAFEAWAVTDASPLFPNEIENPLPDGSYRTSGTNAAWVAWQAARAQPTTEESSAVQPAEPTIDGYPLWSGLPPPVDRVAMSDDEIAEIGNQSGIGRILTGMLDDDQWNNLEPILLRFARAILAAQTDHMEDVRQMVTQSTDAENASKNAGEIVRLELICPKCQVDRLSQPCPTPTINDCWMMGIAQASTAPITQPIRKTLSEDRLDYIARSYFADKGDQEKARDAICDAFKDAQADAQKCTGCNGNGEVGGLRQDGYHSEECPFCKGSGKADLPPLTQPLIAEAARDDVDLLMAACRRALLALAHAASSNNTYHSAYEELETTMDAVHERLYSAAVKRDDAAVDAKQGLTDNQIESGWHQTFSTSNPYCPCNLKSFTKAVRWTLAAIAASTAKESP